MTHSPTILHRSHAAAVTLVLVVAAPGMGFAQTSGTIINGGLNVTGGLVSDTVKATSVVIGGTTFGGGGSTNLTGGVTVTGGLTADTANVTGLFTAGPASVTTLNASGPATLSGGAAVSGGLTASTAAVTGATTLSGGLNVAKGLVSDTANITGNATIVWPPVPRPNSASAVQPVAQPTSWAARSPSPATPMERSSRAPTQTAWASPFRARAPVALMSCFSQATPKAP